MNYLVNILAFVSLFFLVIVKLSPSHLRGIANGCNFCLVLLTPFLSIYYLTKNPPDDYLNGLAYLFLLGFLIYMSVKSCMLVHSSLEKERKEKDTIFNSKKYRDDLIERKTAETVNDLFVRKESSKNIEIDESKIISY